MGNAIFACLSASFAAGELIPFLDPGTQDPTLDSAMKVLLPLAAAATLYAGVTFTHIHLRHAGAGNKRLTEIATFILCGAVGVLQFVISVQPLGGVVDDVGALARALGRVAVDALPAAAAVVFYMGITLVIAHIRAGGEGGGGAAAVAGGEGGSGAAAVAGGGGPAVADDGRVPVPVPVPVRVLEKIALGGAAALLCQIAVAAFYSYVNKY